jgi:hypothetical protein
MSSSPDAPAADGAQGQPESSAAVAADSAPGATRLSIVAERDLLDRYLARLAERVLATASGESVPPRSRIANADIQRSLWLGMLACPTAAAARGRSGAFERFNPASQGFSFRVPKLAVMLKVKVSAAVYVTLHTTLAEQQVAAASEDDDVAAAAAATAASASTKGRALARVWTKLPVGPVNVQVPLGPRTLGESTHGADEFRAAFLDALATLPAGSELLRPRTHRGSLPRDADLSDEASWSSYQAANLIPASDVAGPTFAASIEVEVSAYEDGYEVFLTVLNRTLDEDAQRADIAREIAFPPRAVDTRLYEVQMSATVDTNVVPYSLEQVPASYRYDRAVNALGLSCAVEVERQTDPAAGTYTRLMTRYGSMTSTERILPREHGINGDAIDTSFAAIAADPVAVANRLLAAARQWTDLNWSDAALANRAARRKWNSDARAEAANDAAAAYAELDWIAEGAALLEDKKVRHAVELANETMWRVAKRHDYSAWRPFQLAWLLGCLPTVVDPTGHPEVNIVWFATGGGKTEAYLFLLLVVLFYARLSGTTTGTVAWARFPLRLLALQQTERFAEVVLQAELVRRDTSDLRACEPFSLGYFVGSTSTPNRFYDPHRPHPWPVTTDPRDPAVAEACRVLASCPACDSAVAVRFDDKRWVMTHACDNPECALGGPLPIYTIDDDVYRHAPAVLVGTVDKLAQLAQNTRFKTLLGQAARRCAAHGYTVNPRFCAVEGCDGIWQAVPEGLSALRLEIADELHLLDESLGALDGLYESVLQAIGMRLGNPPLQIVGATATLEGYEAQCHHLYRRTPRRFPVPGPEVGETFWAFTEKGNPLRRYLGVQPRGITYITAAREVARRHHEMLRDTLADTRAVALEIEADPDDPSVLATLRIAADDLYEPLVGYLLRNEDLDNFVGDVGPALELAEADQLVEIRGDANFGDIKRAVARLTNPPSADNERVKLIAATKAIGHGFDVERLGVMVMVGTPTSAAEVIQASARVGRRFPGLVVSIINTMRDRDASIFRYYGPWIRRLDQLVSKVPINRESLPVLRRALSGGLMALLYQVHEPTWLARGGSVRPLRDSRAFKAALEAGAIDRRMLIDELLAAFDIDPTSVYHAAHRVAVETFVDETIRKIHLSASGERSVPDLLDPPIPRSLRDVGAPLDVRVRY